MKAINILLLHNHPSGDPTPSDSDLLLTKRVKDAGMLIVGEVSKVNDDNTDNVFLIKWYLSKF